MPKKTINPVAIFPIFSNTFSEVLGLIFLYMSIVNMVEHELKTEARELISAAIKPPATRPLSQQGEGF